jgi:hypothetical protein
MKHENNGRCEHCHELIDKYPGIDPKLLSWFEFFQTHHPEAHISCAGRGAKDQELCRLNKTSKARWGESAHNYNCAMDFFVELPNLYIYDKHWFETVLAPNLPDFLVWYGLKGSRYFELAHVERVDWKDMREQGLIQLVE